MGQVQSQSERGVAASVDQTHSTATAPTLPQSPSPQPSLDSLIAEAAAYGAEDANESLDEQAQKALDCPCIAHLRNGACGTQFSDAFLCFLKSTAEEKGSDCVHPFVALQNCIKANPGAFSKDILDDDEADKEEARKEETPTQQYKIIPPIWSVESKGKKHKS
ncbi:PREDICTED: mitochondrial intermembrane space import and assembly protein 40 homolog [Ipomoea nil]|uniref:mitochondrial intermembrane space import and assembly protein 40 homolog n=1 Tax=Ipomoea nil TaxID=35883 RepID=UPI00090156E5|nr:PREDICTED: mitochondrial intermembrane space import and assembly protein 40 homolog [Ipomoea nil]